MSGPALERNNQHTGRVLRSALSEKILIAFHHACDPGASVAPGSQVAAHERLWLLRYPALEDC